MTAADMDGLVVFVRRCLDEDEWWAKEASRRDGDGQTETGEHWHWVDPDTDQPVLVDPAVDMLVTDGGSVSLRSVEEYPTRSVGPLPHFAVPVVEEMESTAAGHIARWCPSRVLAEVAAKRRILDLHDGWHVCPTGRGGQSDYCADEDGVGPCPTLLHLAQPYSDRPGFRDKWKVDG